MQDSESSQQMRQEKGGELDWREGVTSSSCEEEEGRERGEEEQRTAAVIAGKPHGADCDGGGGGEVTIKRRRRRRRSPARLDMWSALRWSLALLALVAPAPSSPSRPDASLCPLSEYIDDNDETVREFFECPGLEDPPNYRACCDQKCCPVVDSVLQVRCGSVVHHLTNARIFDSP